MCIGILILIIVDVSRCARLSERTLYLPKNHKYFPKSLEMAKNRPTVLSEFDILGLMCANHKLKKSSIQVV